MTLLWILSAVVLVSVISLIGIFTFGMKSKLFDKTVIILVGFAAGGLMGGAFLHLLPEAVKEGGGDKVFFYALIGFAAFFMMERYLHWRHCHNGVCDIHMFTYLNLLGDGVHNFTDGLIIAASFMTDLKLGVVTTLAVIFHEIPQEIGDFGILVYGGFTKRKALISNFICALMAVMGALAGYMLSSIEGIAIILISFTAGGFVYIAASDLIPELHRQKDTARANRAFAAFALGVIFMITAKFFI
jgi:zinc and cadmium transporter